MPHEYFIHNTSDKKIYVTTLENGNALMENSVHV